MSAPCEHADVHIHVNHHRSGDTNVQYLEITATCSACARPLVFRGLEMGMSPDRPMCSPDSAEARLPIIGQGERVRGKPAGYSIAFGEGGLH